MRLWNSGRSTLLFVQATAAFTIVAVSLALLILKASNPEISAHAREQIVRYFKFDRYGYTKSFGEMDGDPRFWYEEDDDEIYATDFYGDGMSEKEDEYDYYGSRHYEYNDSEYSEGGTADYERFYESDHQYHDTEDEMETQFDFDTEEADVDDSDGGYFDEYYGSMDHENEKAYDQHNNGPIRNEERERWHYLNAENKYNPGIEDSEENAAQYEENSGNVDYHMYAEGLESNLNISHKLPSEHQYDAGMAEEHFQNYPNEKYTWYDDVYEMLNDQVLHESDFMDSHEVDNIGEFAESLSDDDSFNIWIQANSGLDLHGDTLRAKWHENSPMFADQATKRPVIYGLESYSEVQDIHYFERSEIYLL